MQVTLKTLQQQTFKIDIDPEETVRGDGGGRVRDSEGPARGPQPEAPGESRRARVRDPDAFGPRRRAAGRRCAVATGLWPENG